MFQPSLQTVCYLLARMIGMLFVLLLLTFCSLAEEVREEPRKVSVCQLKNDPAGYNQMLVRVTGFASYGFENFTINDPSCSSILGIWLEYGETTAAGTKYCCGEPTARRRPEQLVVEDIPISLVEDERFREFDRLLHRRLDSSVHVTLVGRFFYGRQKKYPNDVYWGSYGHFGCCSLLAIEQIISVDPQDRDDLDYNTSFDETRIAKRGCKYRSLQGIRAESDAIDVQQRAEQGQSELSFNDPKRVASGHLAQLLKIDEKSVAGIKQTRQAPGRFVYEWRPTGKRESYLIVVSRYSWPSFYAKDPRRVAWIIVAVHRFSCR